MGDVFVLTVTAVGLRAIPTNLPTQLELAPFEVVGGRSALVEEKDLGDGRVQPRVPGEGRRRTRPAS